MHQAHHRFAPYRPHHTQNNPEQVYQHAHQQHNGYQHHDSITNTYAGPSSQLVIPPQVANSDDVQVDEEPLYVNAKQYIRILKRRVARARLEELHRLSNERKPYLHESRHKHAMRRPRGPGGRFLTAEEMAAQQSTERDDHGGVPLSV